MKNDNGLNFKFLLTYFAFSKLEVLDAPSSTERGVAVRSNCSSEPAGDGTVNDSMLFELRKSCWIDDDDSDEHDALLLARMFVDASDEEMLFDLYKCDGGYFTYSVKLGDVDGGGSDRGDEMMSVNFSPGINFVCESSVENWGVSILLSWVSCLLDWAIVRLDVNNALFETICHRGILKFFFQKRF